MLGNQFQPNICQAMSNMPRQSFVRTSMRTINTHDEHGNPSWNESPEPNPADWQGLLANDKKLPEPEETDTDSAYHNIGANSVFWHGSPSDDMTQHGPDGLHVGTYHAAKQALTSIIGHKADGADWDGTSPYGQTLLMGQKSRVANGLQHRISKYGGDPLEDYTPAQHLAKNPEYAGDNQLYSGSGMDHSWKPNLFPVSISPNAQIYPHIVSDDTANGEMNFHANARERYENGNTNNKPGNAEGMVYLNKAEDRGSLSVAVPHHSMIQRLDPSTVQRPESYRHTLNDNHGPILQQQLNALKAPKKPKGNPWNVQSSNDPEKPVMGSMERNIRKNMEIAKANQAKEIKPKTAFFVRAILDGINPTGSIFTGYDPQSRAVAPLAPHMTTLDQTSASHPNTMVNIYRGAPAHQKEIAAGDFITTNPQLAKDYAGNGRVIQKQVPMSHVVDDSTEPLGEEYLYRPPMPKQSFVRTYAQWNHDDPNSQLSFQISKAPFVKDNVTIPDYDKITAHVNGIPAGHMLLAPQRVTPDSPHGPGEIADLQVYKHNNGQNFQGMGIAREMAYHAQSQDLWPKHSDTRTPDGDAFARATPELGFSRKRGRMETKPLYYVRQAND